MVFSIEQIPENELQISAIRSQGSGGQNVNKVATAIHLRFDVKASSLSEEMKEMILAFKDHRLTSDGVIIIKAQRHRSQEKNLLDAKERLADIISKATKISKNRKTTKPSRAAKQRRIDGKKQRGSTKKLRTKVKF
ncbi:MAG: alternative ribosome rescue aminoacyl-tRNA hydrolase ArfB [Desulfotalea sp.]